jgi:hypothetical protein
MKYTLGYILKHKNNCQYAPNIPEGIQDMVAVAYWAGEAKARAEERESIRDIKKTIPLGRYHRMVGKILSFFNDTSIEGLKNEHDEFIGWDFDLKN